MTDPPTSTRTSRGGLLHDMIARRDVVRCFSCNVVVQDWESSDNVIDEHRRHSPNCPFLDQLLNNPM